MSVDNNFLRLMFAVYILFTALVLISLLIAMATTRYEGAKQDAESTWRFHAVEFGLFVERQLARVVAVTDCRLCHRDGRPLGLLARSYSDKSDEIFERRYLLDVRKRTPKTTRADSQQRRLRDDISRLNAQVRDIANRIDLLREPLH